MTLRLLPLALLLLTLPACESEGDEEGGEGPNVDCATATVPKFADMSAAWGKCTTCHSSTLTGTARNAAPEGIDFDKFETARTWADTAMSEVYEGAMPIAGYPELTDAEKTQIYNWASCETPN